MHKVRVILTRAVMIITIFFYFFPEIRTQLKRQTRSASLACRGAASLSSRTSRSAASCRTTSKGFQKIRNTKRPTRSSWRSSLTTTTQTQQKKTTGKVRNYQKSTPNGVFCITIEMCVFKLHYYIIIQCRKWKSHTVQDKATVALTFEWFCFHY